MADDMKHRNKVRIEMEKTTHKMKKSEKIHRKRKRERSKRWRKTYRGKGVLSKHTRYMEYRKENSNTNNRVKCQVHTERKSDRVAVEGGKLTVETDQINVCTSLEKGEQDSYLAGVET